MKEEAGANIALALKKMARENPDEASVILQRVSGSSPDMQYRVITFGRLDEWSDTLAAGLRHYGIAPGARAAMFVPPGPEFFALVFALFKVGAVPVLIDPGIGLRHMKTCLQDAEPEIFIGIPKALFARAIFRWAWSSVKHTVVVGSRWGLGRTTLLDIENAGREHLAGFEPEANRPEDTAAILFTSGSTGPPKGVVYTHGIFQDQIECLREMYDIQPGERDVSTFPLFALFGPALGMASIVPAMDATRPAEVVPERIIAAVNDWRATSLFGSPALIETVGRGGEALDASLPSLRRVLSSGAPARPESLRRFSKMLSDPAEIHTPYGATESLPVATMGSKAILEETSAMTQDGKGVCVGHPAPRVEVRIIAITDEAIPAWSSALEVAPWQIGEIVVHGPRTTREYFKRPEATQLAKISDGQGGVWHRMGDLGYCDTSGRLWFCGRKSHRVETPEGPLYTVMCERIFDVHPDVFRTALVGVGVLGKQKPVLCVELDPSRRFDRNARERVIEDLEALAAKHQLTKSIHEFLLHPAFPVDIRHNAKIFREKLKVWAEKKCR